MDYNRLGGAGLRSIYSNKKETGPADQASSRLNAREILLDR